MLFVICQTSLIKAVPLNQIFEIQHITKRLKTSLFGYEHQVCDFGLQHQFLTRPGLAIHFGEIILQELYMGFC
jgi:hypothetical protein